MGINQAHLCSSTARYRYMCRLQSFLKFKEASGISHEKFGQIYSFPYTVTDNKITTAERAV